MKKGTVIVASLLALNTNAAEKYSLCIFGPDSAGDFHEEIVPQASADKCDNFCVCHDLETTCLLGPDSMCNFATAQVTRDFAEECERDFCTCSSHGDYMEVANQRLNLTSQTCLRDFLSSSQGDPSQTTEVIEKGDTSEPPQDTTTPKRPSENPLAPSSPEGSGEGDVEVDQDDSTVTVTFNGHQITSILDKITCRFGPDASTGEYVTAEITLQSYELICKNTEMGFCDCDFDDSLQESQVQLIEQVLLELLEAQQQKIQNLSTGEVIKEVIVEKIVQGEPKVIESESQTDPIILVLIGVGMTLFAVSVALCVAWMVLNGRRKHDQITAIDENGTMAINQSDRRSFPSNGYPVGVIQQDIGNDHGHAEGIPVHIEGQALGSGDRLSHGQNSDIQDLKRNQLYSTLSRTTKMSDMTAEYVVSKSITSKKQRFGEPADLNAKTAADNLETAGHGQQMYGQSTFVRTMTRNNQTPGGANATPGVGSGGQNYNAYDTGAAQISLEPHSGTAFQSRASRSASQGFRSRLANGHQQQQTPAVDPQSQQRDDVEEL